MNDLISRQAAIDAILAVTGNSSVRELYEHVQEHGLSDMWSGGVNAAIDIIIAVPPAQPDRLTDDDFETIRIHLNAQKEKLCNQRRWEEAEEYQRIIDRFMAFAPVQPERIGQKMTNAEAIETLIANYPDACFEQLREAVDVAIEALKAQPETIRPVWKADDRYIKTMFQPFPYCPKCNHYLITGDNYCSVCGRHIDWSEDDDTAD